MIVIKVSVDHIYRGGPEVPADLQISSYLQQPKNNKFKFSLICVLSAVYIFINQNNNDSFFSIKNVKIDPLSKLTSTLINCYQ